MAYRIRCPICRSLMWSSQMEKDPSEVEFLKQESRGGREGFTYSRLKHQSTPKRKFRNYLLEVIRHLVEQRLITPDDLREIYEAKLEEEAELDFLTRKKLAELEAKASKIAKAEKEAGIEKEAMKELVKRETEARKKSKEN